MKKRIIFTDDDPGVQDSFRLVLERAGYEVVIFSSGDALLSGAFETPDLFLLDKQLSGVDGLDICRHLKSSERTAHIPIIMLSASPQIDRQARSAGANDFLEKPFGMKTLLQLISKQFDTIAA